ncbi:hypothetical protein [Helicobacter burdigaliensis]|uniref:hypothetical protein n=1 Tax=Helicobacter burdigaliensis TaxID=2315334 RepID=UPI000EF70DAB|nr:hypothetical protein [Helicobacter burdigaliensis]
MQEVLDTQASIMKFRLCNLCKEQSLAVALLLKALLKGEKTYPKTTISKTQNTHSTPHKTTKQDKTPPTEENSNTPTKDEIFPTLQIDS